MKSKSSTIALLLLGLVIVLYMSVISPMSASLLKTRSQMTDEEIRLGSIELTNNQREDFKARIAVLEKTNETNQATWIMPILNSYAMRVKALVDTMATEAGLVNVEYDEGSLLALPVPRERVPNNQTARRSVRIKAKADYAAAVSFLLRIEKEIPLLTVQCFALKLTKDVRPDQQEFEIVLEWPAKGGVIR